MEAQPWGLLVDDLLSSSQINQIYENIETYLDKPSPIGPLQAPDTMVWIAISQLLPWAYVKNGNTNKAWEIFQETLYSTHAHYFPDVWIGIWSGPDGWVAYLPSDGYEMHGYEGGTWYSLFTPMTDFPVSNSNPDIMFSLSLERLLGIEPSLDGDGIFINTTRSGIDFNVNFPVLHLESEANSISGTYFSSNSGNFYLTIVVPSLAQAVTCEINSLPVSCAVNNYQVKLPLGPFDSNEQITFSVQYS